MYGSLRAKQYFGRKIESKMSKHNVFKVKKKFFG
jgi:hypothetical protein